jgi:ATP-dependent DNA helicase DinG
VPRFEIIASSEDCLHNRCGYFGSCLLHSMRRQAKNADIVVTNHSLLFLDTQAEGKLLPPVRHWVVDEAHGAEQEARSQLSRELDSQLTGEAAKALLRPAGVLRSMLALAQVAEGDRLLLALTQKALTHCEPLANLLESFFSYVKELGELGEQSDYNQLELWIDQRVRESAQWGRLAGSGRSLAARLQEALRSLQALVDVAAGYQELLEEQANLEGLTAKLADALDVLLLVLDGSDTSYVYSALLDRRADKPGGCLVAAYYDVGQTLAAEFYPQNASVIYTSATIAVAGSRPFDYFLRGVGLNQAPGSRLLTLQLGSSYDFDANMTVLVPTDLPEPNQRYQQEQYNDALENLLFAAHTAMGGSVLTLFTNRRDMEQMYARLRDRLQSEQLPLLCQYRGLSRTRLRERFVADERLSLFALRSFWEGFDAPGKTLRCVIIPKLPFGRPNEPLQLEREQREQRAWMRYSLPEAIISLKQAAGRLIRSSQDSGYLVLADKRLISKFYGKEFLAALPSRNIHFLPGQEMAELMRERGAGGEDAWQ